MKFIAWKVITSRAPGHSGSLCLLKRAKIVLFVVIRVASRSVSSATPRDEENTAAIGAIILGHKTTFRGVIAVSFCAQERETKQSTVLADKGFKLHFSQ